MAQTFFFPFLAFGAQVAYGFLASIGFQIYKKTRKDSRDTSNANQNEKFTMKAPSGVHNQAYKNDDLETTE